MCREKKCHGERITIIKWTKMKGGKMISVKINGNNFRGSLKIQLMVQNLRSEGTRDLNTLMTDYMSDTVLAT